MGSLPNSFSLNELIQKIQGLPIESLPKVYDFVSKINVKDNEYHDETSKQQKTIRTCCRPDSIMNTRPLLSIEYKFNRDDLYD